MSTQDRPCYKTSGFHLARFVASWNPSWTSAPPWLKRNAAASKRKHKNSMRFHCHVFSLLCPFFILLSCWMYSCCTLHAITLEPSEHIGSTIMFVGKLQVAPTCQPKIDPVTRHLDLTWHVLLHLSWNPSWTRAPWLKRNAAAAASKENMKTSPWNEWCRHEHHLPPFTWGISKFWHVTWSWFMFLEIWPHSRFFYQIPNPDCRT